jgi:hypothetical protein
MKTPIHILRYGTVGDKAHLEKAISTFDYLAINANSAAYVSGAIAKFVVEKLFNNDQKGYFIDPITYAFQKDIHLLKNKEQKFRKSILKLIHCYGKPVSNVCNDTPIQISDFNKDEDIEAFCKRVLDFQYKIIQQYISQEDMSKYLIYDTRSSLTDIVQLHPKFLIAPYFYLDSTDPSCHDWLDWLKINEKCISIAKRNAYKYGNLPVFAQIVLSQGSLLDTTTIQKIKTTYSNCECDGFTIWVDGLDEHEATFDQLNCFVELLKNIKGKPIYNMYGGFFSILLTHKSINLLDGVSHGLEYGESRAVYPVGGGIPVSKYYVMPLHQRTDFTKAFYLLEHHRVLNTNLSDWGSTEKYYKEVCKCDQCKQTMQDVMINFIKFESDQFYEVKRKNGTTRRKKASAETKENCLYHYLLCKKVEFNIVTKKSVQAILQGLDDEKGNYERCSFIEAHELDYINNWINTIRPLFSGENRNAK